MTKLMMNGWINFETREQFSFLYGLSFLCEIAGIKILRNQIEDIEYSKQVIKSLSVVILSNNFIHF